MRRKVFQPAAMIVGGHVSRVHILDLSVTGALLHADQPPAAATLIELRCGALLRHARVAWTKPKRFGVRFVTALTEVQVKAIVEQRL